MNKKDVVVGAVYVVKVSGVLTEVKIEREGNRKGWYGKNLKTGRSTDT